MPKMYSYQLHKHQYGCHNDVINIKMVFLSIILKPKRLSVCHYPPFYNIFLQQVSYLVTYYVRSNGKYLFFINKYF